MSDVPTEHGYEFFFFAGQKRYKCPCSWESGARCQFDTYDLEEMRRHVTQPHTRDGKPAGGKTRKVVSPILDSEGNQIIRTYDEVLPEGFEGATFKR